MQMQLVNPDPKYPKARLIEPALLGYLYVAASVKPPGLLPLVWPSAKRSNLLRTLKGLARKLERLDGVLSATVFRAIVLPPTVRFSAYLKERKLPVHVANFDVLLLIETLSPAAVKEVECDPAYLELIGVLQADAHEVSIIAARNAKRIGNVDTSRKGLFLFNHFVADDPEVMGQLWDYLAGWYAVETDLDNSVAMVPLERQGSDYAIVNWARWDTSPLHHFWSQLSKKSFWNYVTANLDINHAAAMPVYCRLA